MTLLVTPVATPEEMEVAKKLRYRVFIDEQGFDPSVEIDEYDHKPTTIHFLGKDVEEDKYVAVARVLLDEEQRKAKIGRVAVMPECRGKNYGLALMNGIEDHIREQAGGRVDSFELSAIYARRGFYEKCGYSRTKDDLYLERGIDHCWMDKMAKSAHPSST